MNEQNKFKTLWIAILSLFVLNIATLAWVFLGKRSGPPPVGPVFVEDFLNFSNKQKDDFKPLMKRHFETVLPLREQIQKDKITLIDMVKAEKIDSSTFENRLATLSKEIVENERFTLLHFIEIRDLCTDEQKKIFDEQFLSLVKNQSKNKERNGPPPPR